jgi:hypothetical protein
MGSTPLIPSGLVSIIKADGLPHLPSMDNGEVLGGFSARFSLGKKWKGIAKPKEDGGWGLKIYTLLGRP